MTQVISPQLHSTHAHSQDDNCALFSVADVCEWSSSGWLWDWLHALHISLCTFFSSFYLQFMCPTSYVLVLLPLTIVSARNYFIPKNLCDSCAKGQILLLSCVFVYNSVHVFMFVLDYRFGQATADIKWEEEEERMKPTGREIERVMDGGGRAVGRHNILPSTTYNENTFQHLEKWMWLGKFKLKTKD